MLDFSKFIVTCELSSSSGADIHTVLDQAREITADAFNLPDGILGKLTIDPIVLANRVKLATDKPVIAHLTCRDTTKLGLASRLLGASVLDVDGILALTGDAGSQNVFEVRATGLTQLAADLNTGEFNDKEIKGATKLQIGVACNPNVDGQIDYLKEKVAAGAQFVQTQPVFDLAIAEKFLADVKQAGIKIPILLGIMPLKSVKVAEYFNKNVVGVTIPPQVIEQLVADENAGIEVCLELLKPLKEQLAGVHIMPLGQTDWANQIYEFLEK